MRIDRYFQLNGVENDYTYEMTKSLVHTLSNGQAFYKNCENNLLLVDTDGVILCSIGYGLADLYVKEM